MLSKLSILVQSNLFVIVLCIFLLLDFLHDMVALKNFLFLVLQGENVTLFWNVFEGV